jgi:hypothetical protein
MYYPVRKAILIGSQSPGNTILEGVGQDIDNLVSFLMSPVGGAWRRDEIVAFYDPTCAKVLSAVRNTRTDYLFIYFSGHGGTDIYGRRILSLTDDRIHDKQLLNFNCPRQVIFADACRTHERPAAIGGLPWPREEWDSFTGESWARETFDKYIRNSPSGHLIIHATQDNNISYDNEKGLGGEFTLALLKSVRQYQHSGKEGLLFIPTIINQTTYLLHQRGTEQTPSYVYHQGDFRVPFALVSPHFTYPQPKRTIAKQEDNSLQNALLLGLALVVIASL